MDNYIFNYDIYMITFLSVLCGKLSNYGKLLLLTKTTAMHTGLEQHRERVNTELFLYHLTQKCQCVIDVLRAEGMCQLDFVFCNTNCVPYVQFTEILFGFL